MNLREEGYNFIIILGSFLIGFCLAQIVYSYSVNPVTDNKFFVVNNTVINNSYFINHTNYVNRTEYTVFKEWMMYKKSIQCRGFSFDNASLYTAEGMSMRPSINPDDRLWTVPYTKSLPLVDGDVVIAAVSDGRVIHRVVGVYSGYFVMQGDNNAYTDVEVYNYSQALAVVCGVSW